jgi:hypothetical protein
MVLYRALAKAAFDHVLDVVLGCDNTSPLKKSLLRERFNDVHSFCQLTNEIIDDLQYDTDTEKDIRVTAGDKGLLKAFLDYISYRHRNGNPIEDNWTDITVEEFDTFRVDPEYIGRDRTPAFALFPHTATNGQDKKPTPAEIFKRNIKRDPSLFPVLNDEAYNDSWHRAFVIQASAQGIEDVIDPNYVPTSEDQSELFKEKQKYAFSVLSTKVLTDEGKLIVRDHETTFDAQAAYKQLLQHHRKSAAARLESAATLSYITSAKYDPSTGKSALAFINYWYEKVRVYDSQRNSARRFPDEQKRVMLENAVQGVPQLRTVTDTTNTLEAHGGGESFGFLTYFNLLKDAAANYDNAQGKTKNAPRRALMHDIIRDDDFVYTYDESDDYDIDTPVSVLQAHIHERQQQRTRFSPKQGGRYNGQYHGGQYNGQYNGQKSFYGPRRISMPKERWMQLGEEAREKWDTFEQSDKAIILGINQRSNSFIPAQKAPPGLRKINLHEMSVYDYITSGSDETHDEGFGLTKSEDQDEVDTTFDDHNSSTLLINAATSKTTLPPGDLRRVMSPATARKSSLKVDFHQIIYSVSETKLVNPMSLIDRGANGGVAGSDVRVIDDTSSNRMVDIEGINDYQMTDVRVGDVGGVVETQKGPVIAIFHQYALHGKGSTIHSAGQMEAHHIVVDDKSLHAYGTQTIKTPDGYIIPLVIQQGLARLPIRPYTDQEFDSLPHVVMTSNTAWDPSIMDHNPMLGTMWRAFKSNQTMMDIPIFYDKGGPVNQETRTVVTRVTEGQITNYMTHRDGSARKKAMLQALLQRIFKDVQGCFSQELSLSFYHRLHCLNDDGTTIRQWLSNKVHDRTTSTPTETMLRIAAAAPSFQVIDISDAYLSMPIRYGHILDEETPTISGRIDSNECIMDGETPTISGRIDLTDGEKTPTTTTFKFSCGKATFDPVNARDAQSIQCHQHLDARYNFSSLHNEHGHSEQVVENKVRVKLIVTMRAVCLSVVTRLNDATWQYVIRIAFGFVLLLLEGLKARLISTSDALQGVIEYLQGKQSVAATNQERVYRAHFVQQVSSETSMGIKHVTVESNHMSVIDRGANCGIAGDDMRLMSRPVMERKVSILGIDGHRISDRMVANVGCVMETTQGPIIGVFHHYAIHYGGPTIHCAAQIEQQGHSVEDKSVRVNGTQCIQTTEGYAIPLVFDEGIARLPIRRFTMEEFSTLPHVIMTSTEVWDPTTLDYNPFTDPDRDYRDPITITPDWPFEDAIMQDDQSDSDGSDTFRDELSEFLSHKNRYSDPVYDDPRKKDPDDGDPEPDVVTSCSTFSMSHNYQENESDDGYEYSEDEGGHYENDIEDEDGRNENDNESEDEHDEDDPGSDDEYYEDVAYI